MNVKITIFLLFMACYTLIWGQLQWQEGGMPVSVSYPLYWYNNGGLVAGDNTYFVWSDSQSGSPDLYLQGYDGSGSELWAEDILICDAAKYQGRCQIISSDNGNLILAWHDTRNQQGMPFGEEYDIYMQKINPAGELLWQENGVYVGLCLPYDFQLVSDGYGGCYVGCQSLIEEESVSAFWHISSEGNYYPGWEEGIIFEAGDNNCQITDFDGNLIIFTSLEESSILRKLSPLGDVIWDNLVIADSIIYDVHLYQRDGTLDILYLADNVCLQQVNDLGELLWDDPIILYSGTDIDENLYVAQTEDGYFISPDQESQGRVMMKIDFNGNEIWDEWQEFEQLFGGILTMTNGNFRLWQETEAGVTLWEYDGNANLVSPDEGWWHWDYPAQYLYYQSGFFHEGNITSICWRQINNNYENEVITFQSINENGTAVCGEEGTEISRGRKVEQYCRGVYKINDLEIIVFLKGDYLSGYRMCINMFDEEGFPVGDPDGMPFSDPLAEATQIMGVYQDRLYFIMKYDDPENYDTDRLNLSAVDFSGEPELVWGESGIYLGEGRFTNTNISMTTIPGEENTLLFSWNVHSPFGYGRVQKMADDEFIWQDGGIIYHGQTSNTHSLIAYNDYELRMISWGNGYYLNRLNSNGEPMWDNDILLAGNDIYDLPIAIPLANGNMLFLMGEYINNGLRLVEHRITPDGEDLSGEEGHVITFLNDVYYLDFIDCGDSYTIVTKLGSQEFAIVLRRFTYESEEIGEALVIEGFENKYLKEIDIMNDYLLMFNRISFGGQELSVVDFTGTPSELLPQNPYQYLEDVDSGDSPYTCKDGDDIYFCWQNGSISERPEYPDYFEIGYNWYMQKFRIPATEIEIDEIFSVLNLQLYPNPFNPELNIAWKIDKLNPEKIEVAVYNIKGQQIRNWQVNSVINNLTWDGKNNLGVSCSSGLYFVKIKIGGQSICQKAVLLK